MNTSEQIWQDYHNNLLNFISHRVGNRDLAEDLLQEVFIKIHSRLDSLSDVERLQSWIYQIARNTIIDHHRTNKSTEPLPDSFEDIPVQPNENDEVWQELEACLRPMIEELPEAYRQALVLSELDGLPLKDVAKRLEISLSGAKSRVQRGRARLKELMDELCHFEMDKRGKPISYDCDCLSGKC